VPCVNARTTESRRGSRSGREGGAVATQEECNVASEQPHGSEHDHPLRLADLTIALRLAPSLVAAAAQVRSIAAASSGRDGEATTIPGMSRSTATASSLWKWPWIVAIVYHTARLNFSQYSTERAMSYLVDSLVIPC